MVQLSLYHRRPSSYFSPSIIQFLLTKASEHLHCNKTESFDDNDDDDDGMMTMTMLYRYVLPDRVWFLRCSFLRYPFRYCDLWLGFLYIALAKLQYLNTQLNEKDMVIMAY